MSKSTNTPDSASSGTKARSIHDAGSPDSKAGPKPATNPDGKTPAELPSAEAGKASLHKPAPPDLQSGKPRKLP
ncbi:MULTISPECIES: hypothetical protein [unclassified Rhizobacter]|uniref:hypothetical protein n=1 Tax=unclassified Rhizobacter TaxID=2640088 RepID=UPI0006FA8A0D|nr:MULTISPECIES: hypothetical protein [unclassified Rhizobacter]KQU76926.1 hypothetical protein ASC88_03125 [Rhizobacter sp. Root29]KQV97447.1 hypothetical protein ASC98_12655 [Rhizobacter sp. Root1238]KRB10118.1 hypothetical protein ASE08_11290 [Rhizobacter sp. Root16D2]